MTGPRILVVDDDPGLRRSLDGYLSRHDFVVALASSGEEALDAVTTDPPDLILLDIAMPGMGGLEACRRIRVQSQALPIIVLSVIGEEDEKVQAFNAGADDYVTKPFGVEELRARIGVALRHFANAADDRRGVYECGDLAIDIGRRSVVLQGIEIHLTPLEFGILICLASHADRSVTHQMLWQEAWTSDGAVDIGALRAGIFQLRKKLGDNPLHPRYVLTEPGVGYRFGSAGS